MSPTAFRCSYATFFASCVTASDVAAMICCFSFCASASSFCCRSVRTRSISPTSSLTALALPPLRVDISPPAAWMRRFCSLPYSRDSCEPCSIQLSFWFVRARRSMSTSSLTPLPRRRLSLW